jgi:hypothetical protein
MPPPARLWLAALIAVLGAIGWAGLRPFDLWPANGAQAEREGLNFAGDGIAWLAQPIAWESDASGGAFTLALWIRARAEANPQTRIAVALDDGHDPPLLRIGQKRGALRVDWRERTPQGESRSRQLGRDGVLREGGAHFIAVVSGPDGTRVHIDGEATSDVTSPASVIEVGVPFAGTLLLGSDAEGRLPWSGTIVRLMLLRRALDRSELIALAQSPEAEVQRAAVFLAPEDGSSALVNRGLEGGRLELPTEFRAPRPSRFDVRRAPSWMDAALNLLGFVPLGALIAVRPSSRRATRDVSRGASTRRVCEALALAALLSFAIEWAQISLPSRDSSLYDWLLNALGGTLGAVAALARRRAAPTA